MVMDRLGAAGSSHFARFVNRHGGRLLGDARKRLGKGTGPFHVLLAQRQRLGKLAFPHHNTSKYDDHRMAPKLFPALCSQLTSGGCIPYRRPGRFILLNWSYEDRMGHVGLGEMRAGRVIRDLDHAGNSRLRIRG